MKRVLCLRLLNWPIQRIQRHWLTDGLPVPQSRLAEPAHQHVARPSADALPPLAIFIRPQGGEEPRGRNRAGPVETDLKYVRRILPAARNGPALVAVSNAAWSLGLRPGMPLAEARSIARPVPVRPTPRARHSTRHRSAAPSPPRGPQPIDVLFQEWQPQDDRRELQALAELTRRFAPITALDEMPLPDSLLLDITGCGALFGGESALAEGLLKDLRMAGFRGGVTIADSVAAVWALAHPNGHPLQAALNAPRNTRSSITVDGHLPILLIPPGQQCDHLAALPLAAGRLLPEDIDILRQLGLSTLKQLLALPREDLPARLSASAVLRVRQLTQLIEETMVSLPEVHPVSAEWRSEFPADSRHELQQVLQHVVLRICTELQRRRTGCVRLSCRLYGVPSIPPATDDQQPSSGAAAATAAFVPLVAHLIKPTQSAEQLLDVLTLRLESIPLHSPIQRVHAQAVTAPLPVARQKDLFSATEHIVPQEELATLVNRLSNRLGPRALLTLQRNPDPRPEEMYTRTPLMHKTAECDGQEAAVFPAALTDTLQHLVTPQPFDDKSATSAAVYRPVRLLPFPFLLPLADRDSLLPNGFIWQGQRFRIRGIVGPERLQTAWWTDSPVQRDYYRVTTEVGALFWIFRDLLSGQWYLHGLFD